MAKIYTGTSLQTLKSADTVRDLLDQCAVIHREKTAYIYRRKIRGEDYKVSYPELREDVLSCAEELLNRGAFAGSERIAVIGENSYPWVLVFTAALSGLGAAIPLDHQLPDDEAFSLLERGKASILCYSKRHAGLAERAAAELPGIRQFVLLSQDGGSLPDDDRFIQIDDLLEKGQALRDQGIRRAEVARPKANDLASIVFTSGTTSDSKGVMLSQKNIASNAHACAESFDECAPTRTLSILPLHHTYENTVGMYCMWYLGVTICINDSLRYIADNLRNWEIGIIIGVPLLVENLRQQILRSVRQQKLEWVFHRAERLARFLYRFGIDQRRKIFRVVHKQLGGQLHLILVGGAPLKPEVFDFFETLGIHCCPGYGLSEASPVLCTNTKQKKCRASVGWPLPGVSLKIADEGGSTGSQRSHRIGEVLAQGPNLMIAYLDEPELTAKAFTPDGWLKTGDMGYFDERGALHLTGREKTMLVLSNGKKAFPEEIEELLKSIPGVVEAFVWDEESRRGNVMICAKLQIRRDKIPLPRSADDEEITAWLHQQVNEVNHQMPVYKAVVAFIWTEEEMEMTSTQKVRRPAELASIHRELEYRGLSMQEADGQRIPDTNVFDLKGMAK